MRIKKHFGRRKKRVGCLLAILMCAANLASQRVPSKPSFRLLHTFGISGSTDYDGAFPPAQSLTRGADGSIYGAVEGGGGTACGGYGCGMIYRLSAKGRQEWSAEILYKFRGSSDGAFPQGGIAEDPQGRLYGTTGGDGGASPATTFRLTPEHDRPWEFAVIYNQGGPPPGLILDAEGDLYGPIGPGEYGAGAIAELTPSSGEYWNYNVLYSFHPDFQNGSDGEITYFGLTWDRRGNLYGTTYGGGNFMSCQLSGLGGDGCGTAFQLLPNPDGTWTENVLHRFDAYSGDGEIPYGPVTLDPAGNVYGTTIHGGAYQDGRVFKLTPTGIGSDAVWIETAIYDFPSCAEGCSPGDNMVMDAAGNLYGVAGGGNACEGGYTCGVVFELSPQASGQWTYSVLHKFNGSDGFGPNGLALDGKGNLLGTTVYGGANNTGVIFEITP